MRVMFSDEQSAVYEGDVFRDSPQCMRVMFSDEQSAVYEAPVEPTENVRSPVASVDELLQQVAAPLHGMDDRMSLSSDDDKAPVDLRGSGVMTTATAHPSPPLHSPSLPSPRTPIHPPLTFVANSSSKSALRFQSRKVFRFSFVGVNCS